MVSPQYMDVESRKKIKEQKFVNLRSRMDKESINNQSIGITISGSSQLSKTYGLEA